MTVELAFLIDGRPNRALASVVGEAAGALSLLINRHFFLTGREEVRPNKWVYQWAEAGTEDRLTLYEFLDVPLTWLELRASDASAGAKLRMGIERALSLDSLSLTNPEILLARAREDPEDPVRVRNLGVGGDPENPEVLALLEVALSSPRKEVRRAVGDAAVLRRIKALAPALREAAARESDKNLSAALTFASDQITPDSEPRNPRSDE